MFLVLEPMVVKTVSKRTESAEKSSLAEGSVINLSFLHELNSNAKDKAISDTMKYDANFFKFYIAVILSGVEV